MITEPSMSNLKGRDDYAKQQVKARVVNKKCAIAPTSFCLVSTANFIHKKHLNQRAVS